MNDDELDALGQRLGLDIPRELLIKPFQHSSYVNERAAAAESNERLEFLGDAVIDLAVSEYLYAHFSGLSEGQLTKIKSVVVSGPVLAEKAVTLGIDHCLILGKGEEDSGGRGRSSILGDAFEALVGLIFAERGYTRAAEFVIEQLRPEVERVAAGQHRRDYKTLLQEAVQQMGQKPRYALLSTAGADHRKEFTVRVEAAGEEGVGRGYSKKQAEQAAAKQLYYKLEAQRRAAAKTPRIE